jgi:Major Facilitator Superfamily
MAGVGRRVPAEAGRLGAGRGGHAGAGRDSPHRSGHHRLAAESPGCGILRASPQPSGCPGHYLRPAPATPPTLCRRGSYSPATTHAVCVAGQVGYLGRVTPAVAVAFARPVPRFVTEPEPIPPVPESHTNAYPVAHPDSDSDAVTDGDPVPDGHAVPDSYPVAMTAWVIAETGALVAAPTAALTLSVAGVRACLGAVNRARRRQRASPIDRPHQRAGQPVLLLAAPVAELAPAPAAELAPAPAAELVPVTFGTVPQARAGRLRAWRTRTWGGLPNVFWRLVITLVPGRGLACLYLTLAYYAARGRHLDASQVAVVLAAFGVGWAVGPPVAGWTADRVGPRNVIVAGNMAAWAAYIAAGMARSAAALAAGAAAAGLVFEMWRPAAQSLLATAAVDEIQRKRCMTLLTWVINVLLTVATLAGGALAAYAGWGWLFVASATGAGAFAALAWLLLPPDRPRRHARAPRRGGLVADPLLWAFTALTLLILTAAQQSVVALPVRFAGTGIGPLGYGLIAAINPLTVSVLQPFAQGWLVRLPAVPLCAAGMALIGIGIAVTGAGTGLAWYAGTSVIWTLGEIAAAGLAPAIVASIAPPGQAGAYLGTWGSALGLSTLIAAVAGAAVIRVDGLPLLWACCAAAGVTAGVGCACLSRAVAARRNGEVPAPGYLVGGRS